jgi:acyl-CoA synthetase (AMP-forming)/AMP-acid ligase II
MAVSRYGATSSGGPNFAYELCVQKCRADQIKNLDLSSWKLAFVGAEMISAKTLRAFADKFSACGFNEQSFYPCYGLAESTLFVTGRQDQGVFRSVRLKKNSIRKGIVDLSKESSEHTIEVVGCGNTWGRHDVIIVDPETHKKCAANRIGEIWVSGPSVAKGYFGSANLTTKVFSATVMGESSRKTYLKTGDLGFTDGNDLFVTGRIKDIIVIRGHNYYPYDIEHTVARISSHFIPTGTAAFAIEVNDLTELGIVQEVNRTGLRALDYDEATKLIRASVVKNHGISPGIIALVKPHTIPRTSSGKIQRGKCKNRLIGKQLSELYRWVAHVIHN